MIFSPLSNKLINIHQLSDELDSNIFIGGYYLFLDCNESLGVSSKNYAFKLSSFLIPKNNLKNASKRSSLVHYLIDLEKIEKEDIFSIIKRKKRRYCIRKSIKDNSLTVVVFGINDIDKNAVYDLYCKSMIRLGEIPKTLKKFFENAHLANFICVMHEKKLVACNYLIDAKPFAILCYSFSDPEFWVRNINERLYYETIEFYLKKNYRILDLGPALASDDSHNLFKESFGAKRYSIYEYQNLSLYLKIKITVISSNKRFISFVKRLCLL